MDMQKNIQNVQTAGLGLHYFRLCTYYSFVLVIKKSSSHKLARS